MSSHVLLHTPKAAELKRIAAPLPARGARAVVSLGTRKHSPVPRRRNQPEVGAAVKDAIKRGLGNRSSIFVTTKINPSRCTAAAALAAVKVNVQQLGR